MSAKYGKPVDLATRLDCAFEELTRQELKDMMSQRGLKKRTHKILKFVQTVDLKKTFRYQIHTIPQEQSKPPPPAQSPHKNAFDFTFDRSKSLHSTEQKKNADSSNEKKTEGLAGLKQLSSLLAHGQNSHQSSKGRMALSKPHKSRIAKSVTQMKIARATLQSAFAPTSKTDHSSLFSVRHVVDLSGPDSSDQNHSSSIASSKKVSRKTIMTTHAKNLKKFNLSSAKLEETAPIPELPSLPSRDDSADVFPETNEANEEEVSPSDQKPAALSEAGICPVTFEFVKTTVDNISKVFSVDPILVIDLWLKSDSSKLVVKKLAMDLTLN